MGGGAIMEIRLIQRKVLILVNGGVQKLYLLAMHYENFISNALLFLKHCKFYFYGKLKHTLTNHPFFSIYWMTMVCWQQELQIQWNLH